MHRVLVGVAEKVVVRVESTFFFVESEFGDHFGEKHVIRIVSLNRIRHKTNRFDYLRGTKDYDFLETLRSRLGPVF